MPDQRFLADALLGNLHRPEDGAFGLDVLDVHHQSGVRTAVVDQLARGAGEADEFPVVEDRFDDRDVGGVRGAEVRIVVQDDVTVVDVVAEDRDHTLDDLGHRAHEHWRGVGLGQHVAVLVEEPCTEVLGLTDDRGVGHAEEHRCHFLCCGVQGAADHAHQDRGGQFLGALGGGRAVDDEVAGCIHRSGESRRNNCGGVVLLDDGGAGEGDSHAHPVAVVEAGVQGDRLAILFEGHRAGFHQGVIEGTGLDRFRRGQVIHQGAGLHADVDDFHGAVLEAVPVLLEVGVVEGRLGHFQPGLVNRSGGRSEADLVPLALVARVGEPFELAASGWHILGIELGVGLALQLLIGALDGGGVCAGEREPPGGDELILLVGSQQAGRSHDARVGRDQHLRDLQLRGDLAGEQCAGAACRDEGEVTRIVAAADGVLLDRLGHAELLDLQRAKGGLVHGHVEFFRQTFHGLSGAIEIQIHA